MYIQYKILVEQGWPGWPRKSETKSHISYLVMARKSQTIF